MTKKVVSLLLAMGCVACHEPATAEGVAPDEYVADCDGAAAGETFTSDEAWASFVNAHAAGAVTVDACLAPQVTSPASGAVLDPDAPPVFTFQASCRTTRLLPRGPGRCVPSEGWLTRAFGLLLLESPAFAHCAAVSGTNYWLKLSSASGEVVYSALLTVTSWTPDAAKWKAKLSAHRGASLTLVVERGEFSKGDLQSGPFVPPEGVAFTVKP